MKTMKTFVLAAMILPAAVDQAFSASVVNRDSEPRTLIVTEAGSQTEVVVGVGETLEFCSAGCFVTMPNGDREVLTGSERIEISQGRGRVR